MRKIWVATATYAPESDIDPLVAAAVTKSAAEFAIELTIQRCCANSLEVDPDEWIAQEPIQIILYGADEGP